MTIKRAIFPVLAAMLLPGLALAQSNTVATFNVTKEFTDGDNDTAVTVTIDCNNALILDTEKEITEGPGNGVGFVATNFTPGVASCTVSEGDSPGYTATYDTQSGQATVDGCVFSPLVDGAVYECVVTNNPNPIEITITKEWALEGGLNHYNGVDTYYEVTLTCDNGNINGGSSYCHSFGNGPASKFVQQCISFSSESTSPNEQTFTVTPVAFGDSSCWVNEKTFDSSIDSDGCGNGFAFAIAATDAAGAHDCTITNSVFFEGIPTLSQYGMAIMALLMLGVGFVGFRRFV